MMTLSDQLAKLLSIHLTSFLVDVGKTGIDGGGLFQVTPGAQRFRRLLHWMS